MPNRDGTGPLGKGPGTGRGLGSCGDGRPKGGGRSLGHGRHYNRQETEEKKNN